MYIKVFSASLPVGAGLGSSAALCVATSAALTRLSSHLSQGNDGRVGGETAQALAGSTEALDKGDKNLTAGGGEGNGRGRRPSPSELELINSWAYAGETVLHGTPSGLDNTVSCYGGAIKFVKGVDGSGNVTEVRGQDLEAMFMIWVLASPMCFSGVHAGECLVCRTACVFFVGVVGAP